MYSSSTAAVKNYTAEDTRSAPNECELLWCGREGKGTSDVDPQKK